MKRTHTDKFWGWGSPDKSAELPDSVAPALEDLFGPTAGREPVTDLADVALPDSGLDDSLVQKLKGIVGETGVSTGKLDRLGHSGGKSYPDLIRMRSGRLEIATDAVIYPGRVGEIQPLLDLCSSESLAVVPFGGGSSVVGGLEPLSGENQAVVTLDLGRLNRLEYLDGQSRLATVGAGMLGPELERSLNRKGYTLGHFPQSFEYSTVGGWAATRSAGQASTGYGKIEDLVEGLTFASPIGQTAVEPVPASAAGPPLRELLVGSEGALGVIADVTVKVTPLAEKQHYEGWVFKTFEDGTDAFREVEQSGIKVTVMRLSDPHETAISMLLAGSDSLKSKLGRRYLQLRGYSDGCLAISGFEGPAEGVEQNRDRCAEIFKQYGAISLGRSVGAKWLKQRFEQPYLRDTLLTRGLFVDTLETATTWSNLLNLYRKTGSAVKSEIERRGGPALVMCHISHLYKSGASLYFTILTAQEPNSELEQWRAIKSAASDAIVSNGGTITHHHAVGSDHLPWLEREVGPLACGALARAKEYFDPNGIMNPGKLVSAGTLAKTPLT